MTRPACAGRPGHETCGTWTHTGRAATAEAAAYYDGDAVHQWHGPHRTPPPALQDGWQHLRQLADALRDWHYHPDHSPTVRPTTTGLAHRPEEVA